MSEHFATTAVRRRRGVCAAIRRQEMNWPRRFREAMRRGIRGSSKYGYLALSERGGSQSLELAILRLLIGAPERSRCLPVSALRAAFEPIRPMVFDKAVTGLLQRDIVIRQGELIGLARPVQSLIDLGLIPRV